MPALEIPVEYSAGWQRLWQLIAARIVEQESLVQEADEESKGDSHAQSQNSARRR